MDKPNIPDTEREPREEASKDRKPRQRIHAPFWVHDGIAYEAVNLKGRPAFLSFADGQFEAKDHLEVGNGVLVFPRQSNYLPYEIWLEPRELYVPNLEQIYSGVEWFVSNFFVHPDSRIIKFLSLYLIHSYILTLSPGTIFVWLVGPKRSGKTTFQLLAECLGYRAISGINPSEPAIYRTLGHCVEYGPLIVIREYETASDFMKEIAREGDIPGTKVPRAEKVGERHVVTYFNTYGSRVVASNRLHGGDADLDRFFVIRTIRARPSLPSAMLYRDPDIMERLRKLRNDLLLWKLTAYSSLSIPYSDPRGEITDGRDWQHFGGIITLARMIGEPLENEIRSLIMDYIKEKEAEEEYSSITRILFGIIDRLCDDRHRFEQGFRIASKEVWSELSKLCTEVYEGGVIVPNKLIAPDGSLVTPYKIGKILKEHLFGKRATWREANEDETSKVRGWVWSEESINILRRSMTKGLELNTAGTVGTLGTVSRPELTRQVGGEPESFHQDNQGPTASVILAPETVPTVPRVPQYLPRDLPKNQYVPGPASEPALEADVIRLVEEGVLVKDGEVGFRCARCSCGPYRASWAIRRHLHVCPRMPIEAAESPSSDFGAFWSLINRDGSEQEPQEEGGG